MTVAEAFAPRGTSALARELASLPPKLRTTLRIPDAALLLVDGIVTAAQVLTDDGDPREWQDRLSDVIRRFTTPMAQGDLDDAVAYLATFSETDLPDWIKDLNQPGVQAYLLRLLGAARYDRLKKALQADGAVVTVAVRRGIRAAMPFAVALDDLAAALTPAQVAALTPVDRAVGTLLSVVLELDDSLDKVIDKGLPLELARARADEANALKVDDLAAFAAELRAVVTGRSRSIVQELSAMLSRKVQGARDALVYSADPVSQAASSLIELLDRLLRLAFDDAQVLGWVDTNYASENGMTFIDRGGAVRPTKRAQALCFVYAGQPVSQRSVLHELAAVSIVATRARLQQLKHADTGSAEEMQQLIEAMAAVEGFVVVAIGVAWAAAPQEQLETLRARLEPRSRTIAGRTA